MNIPAFETKQELFKFLKENKQILIAEKKATLKFADAISHNVPVNSENGETIKASDNQSTDDVNTIHAKVVINTTNLMDSHSDVHIPNIWKKSLQESRAIFLLQEHQMKFDKIITDSVKAYTQTLSWKDLGYDFKGSTEALIFDATIEKQRNSFMFDQYVKGYVKNHSVGMIYVEIAMCLNSESKFDADEKANFDKYIEMIANKEVAIEQGYFFAVLQAKIIEGSAVPVGSNYATPTISVSANDNEAVADTSENEPSKDTQKQAINYLFI